MGGVLSVDYGTIHATDYRGNSFAVNGTVYTSTNHRYQVTFPYSCVA